MGCFNVTCSLSHLSIGYLDPVVYFPLVLSKYGDYKVGDSNNQLQGCECFYSPATLPIFGNYDDYGNLESVIEDENVKFLQEKFNCPISDFYDMYHRNINEIPPKLKNICSGMFVHREIYDALIANELDDFGQKNRIRPPLEREYDKYQMELNESLEHAENLGLELDIFNTELFVRPNTFQLQRQSFLKDVYYNCFFEGKFRQQFIDLFVFEASMYSVNSFYFPAMNGCQGGNPYMSKLLYKKSLEIVNKEIRERKKV